MSETIHDWPVQVKPAHSLFHSGGAAGDGFYSGSGAQHLAPEPGGVSTYDMSFATLPLVDGPDVARMASWLFDRVSNRSLMRIPLFCSLQLPGHDLAGASAPDALDVSRGLPWDNDQLFDHGLGWRVETFLPLATPALAGGMTLEIDMAGLAADVLGPGHVIGYGFNFAHKIDDISITGNLARLKLFTPLRRDLEAGDVVTNRPHFVGRCVDPSPFRAMFSYGRWVSPGSVSFQEALL